MGNNAFRILAFTIAALALICVPAAKADTFTLTVVGDGVDITAQLAGYRVSPGVDLITSMTGTLTAPALGYATPTSISGIVPGGAWINRY